MQHLHFASIDSTNAYIKTHYQELEDLSFVSASFQTKGKGRMDRVWQASEGENLLFSVLIKNRPMLACGPFLSLVAAVTVAETLEAFGLKPAIKWPNDVYLEGKKVAGILLEGIGNECLVIGIGLNVNQRTFLGDYRVTPTSLALSLGKEIDLASLREQLFASLEKNLRGCDQKEHFLSYYRQHDYLLGKSVSYQGLSYTVSGIDASFSLLLNREGKTIAVISDEISLL